MAGAAIEAAMGAVMETVSLTYKEIADRFGISDKSSKSLVARKRWARKVGNDGKARIDVPLDALPGDPHGGPDGGLQQAPQRDPDEALHGARMMIARLEVELAAQRDVTAAERRRADAAEADRDRWHALAVRPWWRRLAG